MKVIAIENVRYEGKVYAKGKDFEHKDPIKAIELGLVKLAEDGEEVDSSGVEGIKSTIYRKGKKD